MQLLSGQIIYDDNDQLQITFDSQINPDDLQCRDITILDHSDTPAPDVFGDDYIAGGADDDMIYGQIGEDTNQADGTIDEALTAYREANVNIEIDP